MAKKIREVEGLTNEQRRQAFNIAYSKVSNTTLLRRDSIAKLLNPGLDIDYECRYPTSIDIGDYKRMFDREGMAARVVGIYPDECWAMAPEIVENENPEDTTFEKEWKELEKERSVFNYLQRIDVLSGIGHFGLLLLGLSDGGELEEPVPGINLNTGVKEGNSKHKLLFLKALDESVVSIKTKETAVTSPRFGLPILYEVKFEDKTATGSTSTTRMVHWTRVLHIADGRLMSDVIGTPRMKAVFNRLLDVRKVASGSGEMFWRGGYPGTFFEVDPEVAGDWDDPAEEAFEEQIKLYSEGMQRYMVGAGVKPHPMPGEIADPTGHLKVHVSFIAMSLGIPERILMGSERGELASTTDMEVWNKRVGKRREQYVTPSVIRLFIDRMIIYGVLSEVKVYEVKWPDLDAPSDKDKAEVAKAKTEAFAKYVQGSVDELIGPADYLKFVFGMTAEEIKVIETGAIERVEETEGNENPDNDDE